MNTFEKIENNKHELLSNFNAVKHSRIAEFIDNISIGADGIYYYATVETMKEYLLFVEGSKDLGYEPSPTGVRISDNGDFYTFYYHPDYRSGFICVTLAFQYLEVHRVG